MAANPQRPEEALNPDQVQRLWDKANCTPAHFEQTILADLYRSFRCLGGLAYYQAPGDGYRPAVPHQQVMLLVGHDLFVGIGADDAMLRRWLAAGPAMRRALIVREAWRYALAYPLGFLTAHHVVENSTVGAPWDASASDLLDYSPHQRFSVRRSKRALSGLTMSQAIYGRLFSDPADPNDLRMRRMVWDAFAYEPNRENPLFRAWQHALLKLITQYRGICLPYWWEQCINQALRTRKDFVPLSYDATNHLPPPSSGATGPTVPAAVTSPPPLRETPPEGQDEEPPAGLGVRALMVARQRFADGVFVANTKGAYFHVVRGRLHLVVPGGFESLAAHVSSALDHAELTRALKDEGLIEPDPESGLLERQWGIYPADLVPTKLVARVKLTRFSREAERMLFPDGLPFADNRDLRAGGSR
jgi:hypothetical protein